VAESDVSELETLEYEAGMLFRTREILTNEANRLDELVAEECVHRGCGLTRTQPQLSISFPISRPG
jgi:hypothetical protein